MATTPIYNWPTPDNTDLVKNGALSIRTLGNSIDTTMGTMTPKTLVDAKGDLIAATANDTPARLAVGNNGETLVADSSTSTGLRYTNLFGANKNQILNADFRISQRGTSFSNPNFSYTLDRWLITADGNGTWAVSQQTFTPGTAPVAGYEGANFLRWNRSVAGTTGSYASLVTRLEDVRLFAGQTVTLSFWAKADATRVVRPFIGKNFGSGGSSYESTAGTDISLTTSWVRYSQTFSVPSVAGKTIGTGSYLEIYWTLPLNTTMTIDFWGVQLEAGSVATAFQTATGTIQGEINATKRYTRTTQYGGLPLNLTLSYLTAFGNSYSHYYLFDTPMRSEPTMSVFDAFGNVGKVGAYTAAGAQTSNLTPTFSFLKDNAGQTIGFRFSVAGNYVYGEIYTMTMSSEL